VKVHFLKENIIFKGDNNPMDNLLLNIFGAVSEFEKSLINERQKEGISIAKKNGVQFGRKNVLSNDQIIELREMNDKRIPKTEIAKHFNISRPSVYRYIKTS